LIASTVFSEASECGIEQLYIVLFYALDVLGILLNVNRWVKEI